MLRNSYCFCFWCSVLDLSSNYLRAPVNGFGEEMENSYKRLSILSLVDNRELHVSELPGFLSINPRSLQSDEINHFLCPSIVGTEPGFQIKIDPWFNEYKKCKCFVGYSGRLNFTDRVCSACNPGTFSDKEGNKQNYMQLYCLRNDRIAFVKPHRIRKLCILDIVLQ